MIKTPRITVSLALASVSLAALPVLGSDYTVLPERQEALPSFSACLAHLEATDATDGAAVTPLTVLEDGSTREVARDAEMQRDEGEQTARYRGRMWYHHGRFADHDPAQREVSHSWQEQELLCEGNVLIIRGAQGFTSSTFEPVVSLNSEPLQPAVRAQS